MQKGRCVVERGISSLTVTESRRVGIANARASDTLRNFVDYDIIVNVRSVFKDFFKTLFVEPFVKIG